MPYFFKIQLVYNQCGSYKLPSLQEIQDYCKKEVESLWDEVKRFENPQTYYVDLSQKLWDIKYDLLRKNSDA